MAVMYKYDGYNHKEAVVRAVMIILFKNVKVTFDGYASFVIYPQAKMAMHGNFKRDVGPEINHWLRNFNKCRTKAGDPLCAIMRIYALIRGGLASGWMLAKRLDQHLQAVEQRANPSA